MRKMFGQDKPDVYGVVSVGAQSFKTEVVKNSVSASFDTWHVWLVEDVTGHVVQVNMYDQDKMSSDEFLGYAAVDMSSMAQIKHQFNVMLPQKIDGGAILTQNTIRYDENHFIVKGNIHLI